MIFTRRRPHIFTRPWPNWFLFSFNIPLELAFLSAPWNKTLERRRVKKTRLLTPREAQKSAERARKEAPLWGYQKVKIINVDSIEALHTDKGGKTLHFGSADPHSVINSFKDAGIKREQHGSREGERGFQCSRQAWLLRAFSPAQQPPAFTKTHSYIPQLYCLSLMFTPRWTQISYSLLKVL